MEVFVLFWILCSIAGAAMLSRFGKAGTGCLLGGLLGPIGLIIAWTLVRYEFPGRKLLDALIDMPFALPTAVSGIALTAVFASNGWIGRYLDQFGIKVAYTWIGVVVALTLIGLPFVVRTDLNVDCGLGCSSSN